MNFDKICALRKKLHDCPELSFSEHNTIEILIEFLQTNTKLEIVRREGWFYAKYEAKSEMPCESIAFRADMDAVYVNGTLKHGCGHDGHSATLCALACEVEKICPNVNIYFIFQPAEEVGKGAALCAKLIAEQSITRIYGYHNIPQTKLGTVLVTDGVFACASKGMTMKFFGRQSHAAYPEAGTNPAFAMADIIKSVENVTSCDYDGLVLATVVSVLVGETSPNFGVSAGRGTLSLTIRAEHEKELQSLQNSILDTAASTCKEYGITFTCEFFDVFLDTKNDAKITADAIHRFDTHKIEYIKMTEPFRWSEDFGVYLRACKGMFMGIGAGDIAPLHTDTYEYNDEVIKYATEAFLALI